MLRLDTDTLDNPVTCNNFCNSTFDLFHRDASKNSYDRLERAVSKAANQNLPKKTRNQPGWFKQNENELTKLIDARNLAVSAKINRPTRLSYKRLRDCRRNLKAAINRAKNNWIENVCSGLRDKDASQRGTKICWDKVKTLQKGLTKPKPPQEKMMKKEDGSKCSTSEENAEVFRSHFEKLYGRTPTFDPTVIDLIEPKPAITDISHPPSDDEISTATKGLKNNAPGESGLSPRFFKALTHSNRTFTILKDILIDFWENELPPKQWEIGLLKILPKKRRPLQTWKLQRYYASRSCLQNRS